jgi:DNA-binding response OmpR family regulator
MKSISLLLIEDDADSAEAICLLLGLQGIDVEWAACAGDALAIFQRDPDRHVDVIVLDLMLPDLDGVTLISKLAEIITLPPIVIHSAAAESVALAAGREVGAAAVLRKPTDWDKMRELLESVGVVRLASGS